MPDNKPKHDGMILFFLGAFVMGLLCTLFWISMSEQISSGVRWVRVGELKFASLFTDRYDRLLDQLARLQPKEITPYYLYKMTEMSSEAYRYPIAAILMVMALVSFFRKHKHPYTRKMDLEAVAKEQASAFPVTRPIIKFNPLQANHRLAGSPVPEKLPAFAEALTPEEWVAFHSIPLVDGIPDRDVARLAFAKQLGGRWKGAQALPWYAKALFVAFSMKANNMRVESDEFLGEIASHWEPSRGLVLTPQLRKKIEQNMRDPKLGRVTEKVAAQHAFVIPAMLRCLFMAREQGGVLAPAQFLWLRAVDRTMWYPLNNLGRGSVHTESAGAITHYRTEKVAGKPIPNPQVDAAVEGLIQYIQANEITTFPAKEFARA